MSAEEIYSFLMATTTMARFVVALTLAFIGQCNGFGVIARRDVLKVALGVGALATPLAPAAAKSKSSMNPNKPEGVGANAGAYIYDTYKMEKQGMVGDKGSRGTASKSFDENDTVVKNRRQNGALAYDKNGKKIVNANRNRDPAELGLKQWDGK